MRFFSPKPDRGHEAVWEARAGSCLHVALIVRLEGLGRATDAAWMRSWIAAADFGHRDSTLAVNTQLKGEDFCLFSMALTGLFSVALTGWIRELFVRLFLLLFGFLFESRKQGFGV